MASQSFNVSVWGRQVGGGPDIENLLYSESVTPGVNVIVEVQYNFTLGSPVETDEDGNFCVSLSEIDGTSNNLFVRSESNGRESYFSCGEDSRRLKSTEVSHFSGVCVAILCILNLTRECFILLLLG